jgi:hypothetical protein
LRISSRGRKTKERVEAEETHSCCDGRIGGSLT